MTNQVKQVLKPWGSELWYAHDNRRYVGKIISIKSGRRLSLQYHRRKHETVYVLKGKLTLTIGKRQRKLKPGQAYVIPPRAVHRFSARKGAVTLLEVSTPEVWDIVRLEDDYGRAGG